jgi:glycosyltransferase involved in cell wall biosynthesis
VQFHPRLGPPAAIGPQGFVNEHAFVIGSVGRMAEVKDHIALVHAFLALLAQGGVASSRLRLVIIGDGPCRQACLDVLRASGTAALAWLPGARDDVAQLMRAMNVFVQPSLAEGASNTVLEAMATGLPVVATNHGGIPEAVTTEEDGLLVPERDAVALGHALLRLTEEAGLYERLSRRAAESVRERFEQSRSIARLEGFYRELIS